MSYPNTKRFCSNLQLIPHGNIHSNTDFIYKDEAKYSDNNKIYIDNGFEKNIYLKYNNPIYRIDKSNSLKHVEPQVNSAFDKALDESEKTKINNEIKYEITQQKREIIQDVVEERNRKIKEKEIFEKKQLEETLIRVIKDSLKFTKENSPMIAMMPNKITSAINEIKEKRKIPSSANIKSINNISLGNSFNLSMISNNSTNQARYESNAFLKALGLDLQNLTPENIKIDIDEAYKFIKKWRVNRSDINQIIRMKVVNEIMNLEERRSVQKLKKLNQKYEKFIEYKRNKEMLLIKNQIITEKSYDDENNIETKNIDTQNLCEEIKQMNKENNYFIPDISTINNNHIYNNLQEKKINQIKNESTINARSTNYTIMRNKDLNSNFIDSNNLISTNHSNMNQLNNFSTTNYLDQTNEKNTISIQNKNTILDKNIETIGFSQIQNMKINNKKNQTVSPKKKLDYRLKPKPEVPPKKKRKLVLNSYKSIDRIMKIINSSENLKKNENLCKHFRNIKYNKKIDDLTNKLLNINKLTVQDF